MLKNNFYFRCIETPLVCVLSVITPLLCASAQPLDPESGGRAVIMGDLNIEEDEQQVDPYSVVQSGVLAYFKHLNKLAASLESGAAPEQLKDLGDDALRYLTAAYLHCSIKQGTCPALLEALLEIEVINSRIRNTAACPNLERFWRIWLKNDMERRHDYSVKLGYLQATTEFRQKVRPRFVKCQPTVAGEISSSLSSLQDYFRVRYASGSLARRSLEQNLLLLEGIAQQVPNIFAQVGMDSPATGLEEEPGSKTAPKAAKSAVKKTRK